MIIPEEVKQLFKINSIKKNLRVHFPNGERGDITNTQIPEESFRFTESLCSQSKLRFGLCEANVVEFECVGIKNIKGYEIDVYHEIDISSLSEEFIAEYGMTSDDVAFPFYQLPYGVFVVEECPRQTDMTRRRVIAYTKTDHNDWKFNNLTEKILENNLWKYAGVNLDFSIEGIMKLLIPDSGNFSIGTKTGEPLTNTYFVGTINNNTYQLQVTYDQWKRQGTMPDTWFVECIKEEYASEYVANVSKLRDAIVKIGLSEYLSKKKYLNYVKTSNLYYVNENQYLEVVEEIRLKYDDENRVYFFSDILNPHRNTISYPNIYQEYNVNTSGTSIQRWINYINAEIRIPNRVQLVNLTTGETIFDTGIHENYAYFNSETSLKESASGYFIKVAIPYKKTIVMEKYTASTDKYTDTEQTVYGYSSSKLDLKDIIESYLELDGSFGKYERDGTFSYVKINSNFGLYPSEDLYPDEDLYPNDPSGGTLLHSNYISAWYDDKLTKAYDRVAATYINEEGEEVYAYYQIVDETSEGYNADDYQTYSLSENYLIKNSTFTAEQIEEILATVAENIKDVQYMPADIELVGLPWIEAGDVINVITKDAGIETIVLRRTLSGVQSLRDNYESRG